MAEGSGLAHGNRREVRTNGVEEQFCCRCPAPVVGNLEKFGGERIGAADQVTFDGVCNVAGEEHSVTPGLQAQDE